LLAGASSGRGPCGAFAFGMDDCLLRLENIGVFFDGALYTGSFEGVAFDRLVDVLMEEVEGDFCCSFCAGLSAAGSRLVSPVISCAAVGRSTTGAWLGFVPPESQSSFLELLDALD
jgi:hypothetical protein